MQPFKAIQLVLLTLVILLLKPNSAYSDIEYESQLDRFFKCTVVIDGSYVKSTKSYFWIRINDVIRDDSLGLKSGDYLKVQNGHIGECGFSMNVSSVKRAYYYLSKIPNSWRVYKNQSISIRPIRKDSMYVHFSDTLLELSGKEFRGMMREVSGTYQWNPSYHHADLKIDADTYIKIRRTNPMIARLDKNRRFLDIVEYGETRQQMISPEAEPEPVPIVDKLLQHCSLMESPPYYRTKENDSLLHYLSKHLTFREEWSEMDVNTRFFVEFIVEADGSLSTFTVHRSVHPEFDRLTIEALKQMPEWEAASVRGRKERCKMILPIHIDLRM